MEIGQTIQDFVAPLARGGDFDSAAERRGKHLVLIFFRGAW